MLKFLKTLQKLNLSKKKKKTGREFTKFEIN